MNRSTGHTDHDSAALPRRRRWLRWVLGIVAGLVVVVIGAVVAFFLATRNPEPGEFYTPPDDLTAPAGTILRSEPFTTGIPSDAEAWKILYVSTDEHDQPIAVSGLVVAPRDLPPGPRPVLAWAHGTTGIARPCAPSNSGDPLAGIPDMTGPLDQGWIVTLTDYPGLGTPGPHPYLVGGSEGRAVLDSVRAAHLLDTGIPLDDRYAIWGHSQGGQAALFAGQLADTYLPDQQLVGVAALAPATDLKDNLAAVEGTEAGNVLTILAVESWSAYYPDIPDDTLTDRARRPAERLAEVCLNQPSRFRIVIVGLTLPSTVLAIDPTTNPTWVARLDENTPNPDGITAPLLVAQGLADEIIAPDVTLGWVTARCQADLPTVWDTYPDVNHNGVVGPGGAAALSWTIDRFEGTTVADQCPGP
jgi:acetyl esterase/lipase